MILHFHRSFHITFCKSATILGRCHARRSLGSSISPFSNHRYTAPQSFLQGSLPAALRRVLIQECCRDSHSLTRISSLRFYELCLLAVLGSALRISDAHEAASRARGEARVVGEGGELASCGEWRRGLWRTREVLASIPPSRGPREHSRTESFFVTKTGGVSCRSICGHRQGEARSPGRSGTTVVEKGKRWC
jgi:hypothetical protein